jgi:hypothetical protein
MGKAYDRGARAERAAARLLGGRRVGNTGKTTADVESDWAAVEVKSRQALPAWLKHAVQQSEGAACQSVTPKLPVTVLHELGGRHADDLVLIPMSAFVAWFGGWRGANEDVEG